MAKLGNWIAAFFKAIWGLIRGWQVEESDPIEDSAREAGEQRYDKSAKMQTVLEGTLIRSIANLDAEERDAVRRYREKTVFGNDTGGGSTSGSDDMIVADNIRVTNVKTSGLIPALLGLALGCGLLGAAWWFLGNKQQPTTSAAESADVTGRVRVFWGGKELQPGESASVNVEAKPGDSE